MGMRKLLGETTKRGRAKGLPPAPQSSPWRRFYTASARDSTGTQRPPWSCIHSWAGQGGEDKEEKDPSEVLEE